MPDRTEITLLIFHYCSPPNQGRQLSQADVSFIANSCLSLCSTRRTIARYKLCQAGRKARLLLGDYPMASRRSDRQAGNRAAFEAARQKILKTQTVCGICGKPVDFSYRYPHPLSPTVDHIIPVSKGGHPSDLANLQLAHRCCNRQKSDKLTIEIKQASAGDGDGDGDGIVANNILEQHFNWITYRAGRA